jgi:hypothetical protein
LDEFSLWLKESLLTDPLKDFNTAAIISGVIRTPKTSIEFIELGKNIFNQLITSSLVATTYKVALSIWKLTKAGAK